MDERSAIGGAWRDLRRLRGLAVFGRALTVDGIDLEPGETDTLDAVGEHGPVRMSELADALQIDPSTATRGVDRLERRGLVERQRHLADGRGVAVVLTSSGRRLHERLSERRRHLLDGVLARFDDDERQILAELMPRFVETARSELEALWAAVERGEVD